MSHIQIAQSQTVAGGPIPRVGQTPDQFQIRARVELLAVIRNTALPIPVEERDRLRQQVNDLFKAGELQPLIVQSIVSKINDIVHGAGSPKTTFPAAPTAAERRREVISPKEEAPPMPKGHRF